MSPSRLVVHCFPGFLGQEQDFEFLREQLRCIGDVSVEWRISIAAPRDAEDWSGWTRRWLAENPPHTSAEILLGYSMGGRAAAHLALSAPERFRGLVAISTHPGLESSAERAARVSADEAWARRFEMQDWNTVLEAWNSQPVFAGGASMNGAAAPGRLASRVTKDSVEFRARCARQLRLFSLGRQEKLAPLLLRLRRPQVWITGSLDSKFTQLMSAFAGSSGIRRDAIAGAGHRWPWELTEEAAADAIRKAIEFLLKQDSP